VLTALANGARTPKEIASYTGLSNVHAPKYLSVLNEAGFVERRTSLTAAPGGRSGHYHISDPYLRFYFRFLAGRQAQLALGVQDQALAEISRHMIDFIGTHTWEELCESGFYALVRKRIFRSSLTRLAAFGMHPHKSTWQASIPCRKPWCWANANGR